jgi:hypothetical protein
MAVRTLTVNDDPDQVVQDLNAAFDGTTQTDLKAASATSATTASNATNVTTNINSHAITDIFESDGVTAKIATTISGVKISAYLSANYSYTGPNVVIFDTEEFDTNNVYDNSTGIITPGVGLFVVNAYIHNSLSTNEIRVYHNSTIRAKGGADYYNNTMTVSTLVKITLGSRATRTPDLYRVVHTGS